MKRKPYSSYKPSGVEWLGDVPEHWKVLSLKRIVSTPVSDGPHETPEILDEGIPFVSAEAIKEDKIDFTKIRGFISIEDHMRYSLKYKPKQNDIYVIKSGATTGNVAMVETGAEFNIWSPLAAIRANTKMAFPRFIFNFLKSKEFQTSVELGWSFGTQQNIGMNVIENLFLTLPPLPEQHVIAGFLDRETGRIDALIDKKRRLIELLKEKRTALISRAVTKGLNPTVQTKPSGVEWLGDVPEHWGVKRIRFIAQVIDGDRGKEYPNDTDLTEEGVPFLSSKNLINGYIDYTDMKFISSDKFSKLGQGKLCKGDMVVTVRGTIGNTAVFGAEYYGTGFINAQMMIIRPLSKTLSSFLMCFTLSKMWLLQLDYFSYGTAQQQLSNQVLSNVVVPLPPIREQQAITTFLDVETGKIDRLIAKVEMVTEKLKEYRTALISAVVTGKIDVREAV